MKQNRRYIVTDLHPNYFAGSELKPDPTLGLADSGHQKVTENLKNMVDEDLCLLMFKLLKNKIFLHVRFG